MFSMTDIKAHALYKCFMFFPSIALVLLSIFAYPFLSYLIGFSFSNLILVKVVLSIFSYIVVGFVWIFIANAISFLLNECFSLVIDVYPSSGLSIEESKAVLYGGQATLDLYEFDRNIPNVSNDLIDRISRRGLFSIIFRDIVARRLRATVEHYKNNLSEPVSDYTARRVVKEAGLSQTWLELSINNDYNRNTILQSIFFLYLLVAQPPI